MSKNTEAEFDRLRYINLIETKSLHITKEEMISLINDADLIDEDIPEHADFEFHVDEGDYTRDEVVVEWKQNLTDRQREELRGMSAG